MLPAGAKWITDHYQAILLEQLQALMAQQQMPETPPTTGGQAAEPGTSPTPQVPPSPGPTDAASAATGPAPTPARLDKSPTSIK